MATTTPNGGHDTLPDMTTTKRKRDDESGSESVSLRIQRDMLEVLQPYDTTPSFLEHTFDVNYSSSTKKPRLSEPADKATTIASKLRDSAYSSIALLQDDAAQVSKELMIFLRSNGEQDDRSRLPVEKLKQIQRVEVFAALVREMVENETRPGNVEDKDTPNANGIKPEGSLSRIGTVLTLFGNAPTPKQLFSSMQHAQGDAVVQTELPVEEMSLPNGLTATKIMSPALENSKKGPTFEEVFAPPYSLPALNPPKAHKRTTTRDMNVTWEFKDVVGRGKKSGYTAQTMTTGEWLGYGGTDTQDSVSPREKRKQRDRALSSSDGTQRPTTHITSEEALLKEEEALFRRAYSSFAPSYDNTKALVPEEVKNMVWWQKAGETRFNDVLAIDPALLEEVPDSASKALPVDEVQDEDFALAVQELDELQLDLADAQQVKSKANIDQVLKDISQLLETLASHQRIRNASLLPQNSSASRAPVSPAPIIASRIGKPDDPSEDEVGTYHSLRRELCYLIMKLPPYAVAKLDGQQLATLGVSKLITFEPHDTRGTMEDDQVARLAKYNSRATAAGTSTSTRGSSATTSQHYSATAQRTPAIGQAANTRYGVPTPTAQPQFQRSTSNQSQYGTPSGASGGGLKYGHANQYNKYATVGGRPQQSAYSQASQQYYRPPQSANIPPTPSSFGGYGQSYQAPGQTQTSQQQQSYASQPLFAARSQTAASNAVSYKSNGLREGTYGLGHQNSQSPFPQQQRTASPAQPQYLAQRPTYPATQPPYGQQQQQGGSSSGRATPVFAAPPSQPQTPVNGFQQPGLAPRPASTTPQPSQLQNGLS